MLRNRSGVAVGLLGALGGLGGLCLGAGDTPPQPWREGALGDAQPLRLTQAAVSLQNDGAAYQTTVSFTFQNPTPNTVEGVCYLPVAPGAVERSFAVENDGTVMQGQVRSRDRVIRVYGNITRNRNRGDDPAVLERLDDEWMRATVSPVPPRGEVVLHLTSIGLLEKFGTLRAAQLAMPTTRGAAGGRIACTVEGSIQHAGPVLEVAAPGQVLERIELTNTGHRFELRGPLAHQRLSSVYLDGLESPDPVALSCFRTLDEDGYFFLEVDPSALLATPLEGASYVVVVDPAGNVSSSVWDEARRVLRGLMAELGDGDRVAVLSTVGPEVRLPLGVATEEQRTQGREAVEALERGARRRQVGAVLRSAARDLASVNGPRRVLLLSSGVPERQIEDTHAATRELAGLGGDLALFTLAIGPQGDSGSDLDELAQLGGGRAFPGHAADQVRLLAPTLLDAAMRPVLRFPELQVAGATEICGEPRRALTYGDTLTLSGRYPSGGDTAIRLRGEVAGRLVEALYGGSLEIQRVDQPWVATLWAARRVQELRREGAQLNASESCVADFTLRLCERFGILGEDTVSLALEPALSAAMPQLVGPAAALEPVSPFLAAALAGLEQAQELSRRDAPRGVPTLTPGRAGLVSPLAPASRGAPSLPPAPHR